jgi:hypothetical protein
MIVGTSPLDRHEIRLASAGLLPTTSLGSCLLMRALRRGESHPWQSKSAPAYANANAGNCDRWNYGDAAHSRFTGQEL